MTGMPYVSFLVVLAPHVNVITSGERCTYAGIYTTYDRHGSKFDRERRERRHANCEKDSGSCLQCLKGTLQRCEGAGSRCRPLRPAVLGRRIITAVVF